MKRKDFLKSLVAIPFLGALLNSPGSKAKALPPPEISEARIVSDPHEKKYLEMIATIQDQIIVLHPGCLIEISRRPDLDIKVTCPDRRVYRQTSKEVHGLQGELETWRSLLRLTKEPIMTIEQLRLITYGHPINLT